MLALAATKKSGEKPPLKIVIAGNPNAGKTTLFNALTHSRLRTGNYHGVTCTAAQKSSGGALYVDVPGMYSFFAYTKEEGEGAREMSSADIIINVVDATTLLQSLALTQRLIKSGKRTVVYLTKLSVLKRRGGFVDEEKLSRLLGVPVFSCSPKGLKRAIFSVDFSSYKKEKIALSAAYYGGNLKIGKVERLFYNKIFSLLFFFLSLTFAFFITFQSGLPGATLKAAFERILVDKSSAYISKRLSNPLLKSFICDGVISGVGGVLSFIPQITILYFTLILLDESGILSSLSFTCDGIFEKLSLSGRAVFSLVSGFGCTAAAISTTRGFAENSSRRRTVAALPFIPCGAKAPLFITFLSPLFKNPFPAVCALYFGGVALALATSALFGGKRENLISEVSPVARPSFFATFKRLFFQISSFIIKVSTYVFAFCSVSWLLSHFSAGFCWCSPQESIAGVLSRALCPLFYPMGIRDWRIAYAAISGFSAKENVAAAILFLAPEGLALSAPSTSALCVFFLTCPACISAFSAACREIGFKTALKYNAAQLLFAFLLAYATYFIAGIL